VRSFTKHEKSLMRAVPARVRSFCTLIVLFSAAVSSTPTGWAEEAAAQKSSLGRKLEDFTLRDAAGKSHSLGDSSDKQTVVIAFLGTECPLATLYAPRLVQLAERFEKRGVAFIGINANQQDSLSELAQYGKQHEIKFPLLKDVGNVVADALGAVRTPEVFVLDSDRKIRYHGRIDDQYLVGRQRKKATREDLALALEDVLSGRQVATPETDAPGCLIGRVHKASGDTQVTYTKHIAPLLNRHCVECHREGEIAPFALTKYSEVAGWAETLTEVVADNRMPPWHANPEYGHFSNDRRLSDAEKELLARWVTAGTPEGDPRDLPAPPQFAAGWRLPRVDQEVFMSDEAFQVPAEGTVNYKYYVVDPGFKEDKWVQAAECKAGNRSVVHHIILFYRPPGGRRGEDNIGNGFLTATAPGANPLSLEGGMAKRVPAGSKLVFQMHYTPNGSPQQDRSSVGLMFAPAESIRKEVSTVAAETELIFIPPRVADYEHQAWHTFGRDTLLLSLFPHMHLRGKSFRYEAQYPDGTKEILLDVPRYDFAWQQTYALKEPKRLPAGTKIHCIAHYDNSVENVANPNPDRIVHWGEQTWDEMLMGFMDTTDPEPSAEPPAKKPSRGDVSLRVPAK
jgi:peroxiredoxin